MTGSWFWDGSRCTPHTLTHTHTLLEHSFSSTWPMHMVSFHFSDRFGTGTYEHRDFVRSMSTARPRLTSPLVSGWPSFLTPTFWTLPILQVPIQPENSPCLQRSPSLMPSSVLVLSAKSIFLGQEPCLLLFPMLPSNPRNVVLPFDVITKNI